MKTALQRARKRMANWLKKSKGKPQYMFQASYCYRLMKRRRIKWLRQRKRP